VASVGLDLPEAIGAVDGAIHARLERDLRLVAAGRADHGEVLTGNVLVAALVAARPTDVADVIAGLTTRPPAGTAAGAALRVRGEALLDVVLLISGRVDELHPTVDAGQRSVDVGHETFLSSGAMRGPSRVRDGHDGRRDGADASERPAPRYPGAVMESLSRGARVDRWRDHTPISRNGRCNSRDAQTPAPTVASSGITGIARRRDSPARAAPVGFGTPCHAQRNPREPVRSARAA